MKQCPVCQSTYEDRVDFCFKDGAVLEPVEVSADPTALPDPGSGKVPIADAPTQVRKKPRGRGMFARPSVADMLTVSGSKVPPAGGNRVVADEVPTVLGTPTAADEAELGTGMPAAVVVAGEMEDAFASSDVGSSPVPDLSEAETFVEESEDEEDFTELPAGDPTSLPDPPSATDLPFSNPSNDEAFEAPGTEDESWAAALDVGVSASAVDVPVSQDAVDDSNIAPPGLEPPEKTVSLDDSWFGEESEIGDPIAESPEEAVQASETTELFPELPGQDESDDDADLAGSSDGVSSAPIEDPGFADVLGSDEVGFDDRSWSAGGGAVRSEGNISPRMLAIGFGVLAAAVTLTVIFSADDSDALPPAPAAQVESTAPTSPPEPLPVEPAVEEPVVEETAEEADAAADEAVGDEAFAVGAGSASVTPTPTPTPTPPPPPPPAAPVVETTPPPAPSPPPVVTPPPPVRTPPPADTRTAEANPPPSVWTGAPASEATPPPPAAAESNPWGAPVETVSRGRLTITTDPPQAIVYINERRIGRSPTSTEVDFGAHNVRVEKLDYRTDTRVVNVQSNEVSVPIRLASAALVGKCNLLGEPGADVAMNGRRIGSLPLTVECSPGVHRFDIQPASGGDPFTKSVAVTFVHPGETENLFLTP